MDEVLQTADEPRDGNEHFGRLIKEADEAFSREMNSRMRHEQVTMSQSTVLYELAHAPGMTLSLKELEARMHAAQSTVWGVVSRLERAGLVTSYVDPDDARARLVRLTEAGYSKYEVCSSVIIDMEDLVASAMTPEEHDELIELLERVIDLLRD